MATNVVMPQMGESIAEGTIVRWIKKVGDMVDRDEPLFEISTDKVDAEIPSPAAGRLSEIKVKEGETVPVNSVVAIIGGASAALVSEEALVSNEAVANEAEPTLPAAAAGQAPADQQKTTTVAAPVAASEHANDEEDEAEDSPRQRSSPLVRRIAREHNVDLRTCTAPASTAE